MHNDKFKELSANLTREKFIKAANKVHELKYGYDDVKIKTMSDNIIVECYLHGNFATVGETHLQDYESGRCPICEEQRRMEKRNKLLNDFIVRAVNENGTAFCDYQRTEWAPNQYGVPSINVNIFCRTHGWFITSRLAYFNRRKKHLCCPNARGY
jgi:hypothetical protein